MGNKNAENFHEVVYSGRIFRVRFRGIWSWD